jgi:hypothetical protein
LRSSGVSAQNRLPRGMVGLTVSSRSSAKWRHRRRLQAGRIRARLKPAEQNQDQKDDNHDAQPTTTIVAGAVEWAAPKPTETSNQDDDQDN